MIWLIEVVRQWIMIFYNRWVPKIKLLIEQRDHLIVRTMSYEYNVIQI